MNTVHLPLIPVDGMVAMFRKEDGQLLKVWTEEDLSKLTEHARVREANEEIDRANLKSLRTALRSLARITSHEDEEKITFEQVARAAAYFGEAAGLPILHEYVESVGTPEYEVDYIV